VSSYFSAVSRPANSTQPPLAQESEIDVDVNQIARPGTPNTQQQQQHDPIIVVNPGNDTRTQQNNPSVELNPDDITADPGLRKPIEELDANIRDAARREYLVMGPCQPVGHKFPRKLFAKQMRSFQEKWFKKYDWLEYSMAKDATFYFYCFLFKQPRAENFGMMVLNPLQRLGLIIGRMQLKLVIFFMLVKISIVLTIKLGNTARLSEISGNVWIMCWLLLARRTRNNIKLALLLC
jgi:hypothetical protein